MSLRGILRRKANHHSVDVGEDWGIYLTVNGYDLLNRRPVMSPTRARISPEQAEAIIAQDPDVFKFNGLTFGRWQGEKFEEGQKLFFKETPDIVFQTSDGRHGVRLRCPPGKPHVIAPTAELI